MAQHRAPKSILLFILAIGLAGSVSINAKSISAAPPPPPVLFLPQVVRACSGPCPLYISNTDGNDSNSGADSLHPLKTIAKVNSLNLQPGSSVLFKCGDVWRGEMLLVSKSGSPDSPITFSSYPSNCPNQPRLDGTQPVVGWTVFAVNIYTADLDTGANLSLFSSANGATLYAINQLFRDGQRLTMGRWPNLDAPDGGYASIDSQPAANQIGDGQLSPGNWQGAAVHLKVTRWSMINRDVTSQSGGVLTLNANTSCPLTANCAGWGYFLNNHLNTLDQEGEWFYDRTSRKIYLFTSNNPNNSFVEAGVVLKNDDRNWGAVNLGSDLGTPVHDILIENFAIRGWFRSGIVSPTNLTPDENSSLTVRNNTIQDVDDSGINLFSWVFNAADGMDGWRGGNSILIQNNLIDGANHFGIHTPSRLTTIESNTIRNIGLVKNLNESGLGCGKTGGEGTCTEDGAGLRIYVDNPARSGYGFNVRYNRFENIAYNGIQTFGSTSTFSYNIFDHTCIVKGDGGAINSFGSGNMTNSSVHDLQILNNLILYTIGNTDGTYPTYRALFGFGIYLDQGSLNITTRGNTVAYSTASGILYQMSSGAIENNTLFQNANGTLWADQVHLTDNPTRINAFNDNIMVSVNNHSRNLALTNAGQIAAGDNNHYYHAVDPNLQVLLGGQNKSLAQWQAASGLDSHAQTSSVTYAATLRLYVNESDVPVIISIASGTFASLDGISLGSSFNLDAYTSRVVSYTP
jgi:parallel beta-helix repeat protein